MSEDNKDEKRDDEDEKEETIGDVIKRADMLIKLQKQIDKRLFRLMFIALNDTPISDRAWELINEMVAKGLVTEDQVQKARRKVERYLQTL